MRKYRENVFFEEKKDFKNLSSCRCSFCKILFHSIMDVGVVRVPNRQDFKF